jgi:hypothetical protein
MVSSKPININILNADVRHELHELKVLTFVYLLQQ